ncbi:zf-TFIIB domain-containing protein [Herbaspirillum sp. NPDC101397]|uniref:TFIIB-type zinc ribbon-containing protein n=1 Tax=Herbaspirillum sp. NPDC101397 TaxID=3364006 RepID=UPI00383AA085
MKCPVCTTVNLSMSDRQGVEIDYCQQCRGVWLDRGELDKLIERAQAVAPQAAVRAPAPPQQQYAPQQPASQQRGYDDRFGHGREYKDHSDYRSRKKKGFLGEIFDFD